ncbi:MAG: hypothetical protein NTW28_00520 [Candidatus Solibacter sp.]|nr:hypothetical protein [Candidatus Solibacter sp.]
MSKLEKKSKEAPGKAEPKGRLVALEGSRGSALLLEAQRLARLCRGKSEPAFSRWDASGTFYELRISKPKIRTLALTPRTLVLLYASDLLFRLRWEIEPTMKEGRTVVVAPYVETAIAFGMATGLPKEWLKELFAFAPKADATLRLKEKKKDKGKAKDKKADRAMAGFAEFCCSSLAKDHPDWDLADLRGGMLNYLAGLEGEDEIRRLGKKLPKALRKA